MTTPMGQLFPASVDAVLIEIGGLVPIVLFIVGFVRWSLRRFTAAVDERLEPIHRRIDEHMDEEERSLVEHDVRLAYLTGAVSAIAGSLGVQLDAPPPPRNR